MRITTKVTKDGALIAVCAETGEVIEGLTSVEQESVFRNGMIETVLTITVADCLLLRTQSNE